MGGLGCPWRPTIYNWTDLFRCPVKVQVGAETGRVCGSGVGVYSITQMEIWASSADLVVAELVERERWMDFGVEEDRALLVER